MRRRRAASLIVGSLPLAIGCGISAAPGALAVSGSTASEPLRIGVEPAHAAVADGRAVLIDVRGPLGYQSEHAAGAMLLSIDDIERSPKDALAALPTGKQAILYCT